MPSTEIHGHRVFYHLEGPQDGAVIAFVNGLTQYSDLWDGYTRHFTARGYRVLRFDLLGQGRSEKPALGVPFDAHWQTLDGIFDHAGIARAHVTGISYGGTVALQYACNRPDRCETLIPMSCFAEMPPQLYQLGCGLYDALVSGGLSSLQRWLMPMNMSDAWLAENADALPAMMRRGYAINDLYALQNLMESVKDFGSIVGQLSRIACPTMILNGEFDFFTPRRCHEVLRAHIPQSRLVIVQNAYHAYTLEHPAVTMRLMGEFYDQVRDGRWTGDQSVWIACGSVDDAEPWMPYDGDHMRAIAVPAPPPARQPATDKPPRRKPRARRSVPPAAGGSTDAA